MATYPHQIPHPNLIETLLLSALWHFSKIYKIFLDNRISGIPENF